MLLIGMVLLAIFAVGLIITARRAWADPTLSRVFWPLLMGLLTYISFEIVLWSLNLPLAVMITVGLMPLIIVMMGYRYYEYYNKPENKQKNEPKSKSAEEV